MRMLIVSVLVLLTALPLAAQFRIDLGEGRDLTITQAVQVWDVASFYTGSQADRRNDIYLRRGRFGVEGTARRDLRFSLSFAYDGIGKDQSTPTAGSPNAGDNHDLFVWDATWIWSASPAVNVVFGYFRPQVGKEQMSSEFNVISFDKSLADGQPRMHLVGRSSGREAGVNLGGLFLSDGWSLNYNAGIFDPSSEAIVGVGRKWAPLVTARLALSIGDPEMQEYRITYAQAGHGGRHGVTLGVNAARQGITDLFTSNALYGADLLVNMGSLDLSGEVDWLRRGDGKYFSTSPASTTQDLVYAFKAGWRIPCGETQAIEPNFMVTGERADIGREGLQPMNPLTGSKSRDLYDAGVNWLIDRDRCKLNLHFVWGRDYAMNRPFFSYLGLGTQLIY